MSEFFRSIDRAISGEHPYDWTPPVDTSIVDAFVPPFDLPGILEMQDRINEDIANFVAAERGFVVRFVAGIPEPDEDEPVGYDGFGAPLYAHQIPAEGTE